MKSAVQKRSVVIDGHKTSVSLEEAFWGALKISLIANKQRCRSWSRKSTRRASRASRAIFPRQSACTCWSTSARGNQGEGTDCERFTLLCRTGSWLRNGMTPAAKCRRLATMLRAKAEQERDPEARAEWQYTARGYLILANQFERNGCKNISYASFPRIRDLDEEAA